ncbi:MAG: hypothetical protein R3301_16110, partial [Saprospiraceae bacterium]|nr:hypothetical protein [Saprospiraceae bacterium]
YGWKQFKRWEWFMEQRTWSSNGRIDRRAYLRALAQYQRQRNHTQRSSDPWTPLGPEEWVNGNDGYNPGNGRVNAIAEHPLDTNILFVGTPSGGLWKSEDAGATWTPHTDDFAQLGISAIVIDPTDPDVMYVGTGDGDGFDTYSIGVMKSEDGGVTWTPAGMLSAGVFVVRKMAMDPGNTQVLYAATSDGLYRTTNGGTSWLQLMSGSFHDVKLHPTDHDTVYVCSNHFYRSTDGGGSFTEVDDTDGLADPAIVNRYRIGVSPDEPDWVYVLSGEASDGSFEGLYRSTNAGATFTLQTSTPNVFNYSSTGAGGGGQCWYNMALAVDPNDAEVVYTGGINIWKSINAGIDLDIVTQWIYGNGFGYVHADIHDLVMVGDRLYVGSDGGIFKSNNDGDDWSDLSGGLSITQFYRMGGTPQSAGLILAGSQDNGSNLLSGGIWTHVYGADGMEAIINPANSSFMYVSYQGGGIQRSTDGGINFSSSTNGINEEGAWVTPYMLHPTNSNTLFAAFDNVWKSTSSGSTWTKISGIDAGNLNALEVAPSNPDYIYTSDNGILYRTTDGGGVWDTLTAGLPGHFITDITVHPADPEQLWLTFSGYALTDRVYYSSDAGQTWSDYSTGLPGIPVNTVVRQPYSDNLLYIGTDVGVYYRDQTMGSWQPFGTALPNVIIYELEIHQSSGKLRAATFGRGLWETNLVSIPIPTQLYVAHDATGGQTGFSWADAYGDLQLALEHATVLGSPVQVWIKEGTYLPHPTNRTVSFGLPDGITLIGGFAGTEADTSERIVAAHPVHLSGDIGIPGTAVDNSFTVVKIQSGTAVSIIDLTVRDGNANHPSNTFQQRGGGIRCLGNAYFNGLTITACFAADQGGALFGSGPGTITVNNLVISGNFGYDPVHIRNGKQLVVNGEQAISN